MNSQDLQERKQELMESLKDALINVERIRGAIWFCDELITKLQGNGLDVTEVPPDAPAE
jgi:hypothetical protein